MRLETDFLLMAQALGASIDRVLDWLGGEADASITMTVQDHGLAEEADALLSEVRAFVIEQRRASISGVQRQFKLGYANKHCISYHQIGTAIRFEPKDVAAYSERCKRGPQTGGRNTWESLSATGKSETSGLSRRHTTVSDINKRLQELEKGSARPASTRPSAKLS